MNRAISVALALLIAPTLHGYSVLTHEAIIDSAWDQNIKPLLLKRFPNATPDEMRQAHGYAYGGCIIQDMGYYPFREQILQRSTSLRKRSGNDFVANEIADSQDLNEYAFALGSLAHYAADNEGHRIAVNPSVGAEYPKLESRFGRDVTYADNPTAHLKVEFGFDVLQVSRGNYASQSYRDFIGFQVSKELLDRAFHDTYGMELKDVFTNVDLALGAYRRAVSVIIPEMTRDGVEHKQEGFDLRRRRTSTAPSLSTISLARATKSLGAAPTRSPASARGYCHSSFASCRRWDRSKARRSSRPRHRPPNGSRTASIRRSPTLSRSVGGSRQGTTSAG